MDNIEISLKASRASLLFLNHYFCIFDNIKQLFVLQKSDEENLFIIDWIYVLRIVNFNIFDNMKTCLSNLLVNLLI